MPYASGRVIHDADAHIMELPGFLNDHLEAKYRGRVGDDVLFPRHDGFHSHLKDARDGRDFDDSQIRSPRTGRRSVLPAARIGRARSTFWASRANSCSRRRC